MGDRMQKNYEAVKHPLGNLKESVDSIRTSVKDLYELDEDNYQMIRNLQKALDEANNRINHLQQKHNHTCKLIGIGLLTLGFGGMLVKKLVEKHEEKINELETWVKVLKNPEEEKAEESDG